MCVCVQEGTLDGTISFCLHSLLAMNGQIINKPDYLKEDDGLRLCRLLGVISNRTTDIRLTS